MSQQELLIRVVRILDAMGIDYMVTGSFASSMHGEPRLTHDIDLVVALSEDQCDRLLLAFPPSDYYLSAQAIREAVRDRRMFNLLELATGDKVDFWILTGDPFDASRFARKRSEELAGVLLKVSTPEDTIVAKLRWAQESGGSEKQFTDALRVFEIQHSLLDLDYLDTWTKRLNVTPLWERLKVEAEPL